MGDFARDYAWGQDAKPTDYVDVPASFMGIRRADGRVATRNYIGVLTSVNCSATVAGFIAEEVKRSGMLNDYPNIDGVAAFSVFAPWKVNDGSVRHCTVMAYSLGLDSVTTNRAV